MWLPGIEIPILIEKSQYQSIGHSSVSNDFFTCITHHNQNSLGENKVKTKLTASKDFFLKMLSVFVFILA